MVGSGLTVVLSVAWGHIVIEITHLVMSTPQTQPSLQWGPKRLEQLEKV